MCTRSTLLLSVFGQSTLFLLLVSVVLLPVQGQKREMKRGIRDFENARYTEAIAHFEAVAALDPGNSEALTMLANCYRLTDQYTKALEWYSLAAKQEALSREHLFYYGRMLRMHEQYKEAGLVFERYTANNSTDPRGPKMTYSCLAAQSLRDAPSAYEVYLADGPNSPAAEFAPSLSPEGLIFASDRASATGKRQSDRTGRSFLDLYFAGGQPFESLQPPVRMSVRINTESHEGAASLSPDGQTLYFTRTIEARHHPDLSDPNISVLKIFRAERQGDAWMNIQELPFNSNRYSTGHPSISPDGDKLFFASNRPGGMGGADLYYVLWQGDQWSDPINLGPEINTEGNEMFPYLHADGTLYFASDLHPGLGGLDLFAAEYDNGKWTGVTNLKAGVNSPKDDFGLVFNSNKTKGYLSSNRDGSAVDDLYLLTPREERTPRMDRTEVADLSELKQEGAEAESDTFDFRSEQEAGRPQPGRYTDAEGNPYLIIGGQVLRNQPAKFDMEHAEPITDVLVYLLKTGEPIDRARTDAQGRFLFRLEDPNANYILLARKNGLYTSKKNFQAQGIMNSNDLRLRMYMEGVVVNESTDKMPPTEFALDSYELSAKDINRLELALEVLYENPDLRIEIGGHACPIGNEDYNRQLSAKRAQAAAQYLLDRGVDPELISTEAYGESRLLIVNPETEAEYAANRRTEFVVTSFGQQDKPFTLKEASMKGDERVDQYNPSFRFEHLEEVEEGMPKTEPVLLPSVYVVKDGDTLYGISREYGITVEQIRILNNLKKGDVLRVGQKLNLR